MVIHEHQSLTASFFRGVNSPELFKEFFTLFQAWDHLNLDDKCKCEKIHEAWEGLKQHPKGDEMGEALSCMNDIGREEGREYLFDAAKRVDLPGYTDLTLPKLAMVLWLKHRRAFRDIYDYFNIEKTKSLKVLIGRGPVPCQPDEADIERFKQGLKEILKKDGEGPKLKIDASSHPEGKWFMVIPHEHFVKPDFVFKSDNDEITTNERRPVFELIIIYHPEKGIIKIKAGGKGNRKAEAVAALFSTELLKRRHDHFQVAKICQLEKVLDPAFKMLPRPDDSFKSARVSEIVFSPLSNLSVVHTVRCKRTEALIADAREYLAGVGVSPGGVQPLSVSIQFQFQGVGRKKAKTVVLKPNNHNLDETPRDRYVEGILSRLEVINVTDNTPSVII